MSKEKEPVFLFLGVCDDPEIAKDDLEVVRDMHDAKVIGTYDAAIATKEAEGSVTIKRSETRHAGWTGVAAGAVVGLLFPPSIIGMTAAGGAAGGLIGSLARCPATTSRNSGKPSIPVKRRSSSSARRR
ncbi:hypothetical protein E3T37_10290 [Cryobacterium sp. TMT2-10]|uniref:hypothetical protein n=1 Tax=Cryobacterium sp. TMT2-10 TaxID=1259244 RepID=UPI00106D0B1C|nr:hypothetical protein [Cryobacterium sp. TMT2-10]TFD38263.1 hypothetical protein E3T37_10290 [Cryobacterium sp. TMT2-10]